MTQKCPFYIIDEFLSPLKCEEVIGILNNIVPDTNKNGIPQSSFKFNKLLDIRIFPLLEDYIPLIEQYYNFEYRGTTPFDYEWYPQDCNGSLPHCENSNIIGGKWTKTQDRDFTGIIFLNTYNTNDEFDPDHEVYGGRLGFPNHHFSFNPIRGQMIIFPSGPYFINYTEKILAGDLNQIRFHIASADKFVYNPNDYQGNYKTWFN